MSPYFKEYVGLFNKDISHDSDKLQRSGPTPFFFWQTQILESGRRKKWKEENLILLHVLP